MSLQNPSEAVAHCGTVPAPVSTSVSPARVKSLGKSEVIIHKRETWYQLLASQETLPMCEAQSEGQITPSVHCVRQKDFAPLVSGGFKHTLGSLK